MRLNSNKSSITMFIFTLTVVIASVYLSLKKKEKEKTPQDSQKKRVEKNLEIPARIEIVRKGPKIPEENSSVKTKKDSTPLLPERKHPLASRESKGLESERNEESKDRPKESLPKTKESEITAEVKPKKSVKPETVVIDFSKELVSDGSKFINNPSFPLIYNDFSEIGIHRYLDEMINRLKGRLFLIDSNYDIVAELNSELEVIASKSEIKSTNYLAVDRPRDLTSELKRLKEKLDRRYKFEYISLVMPDRFEEAIYGGIVKALSQKKLFEYDALYGETKYLDGSLAFAIQSGKLSDGKRVTLDIQFLLRRL